MRIIRWLDRNLEVALMVVAMIVLIFVMGAQVVARKFLGASIDWSEELGRYLFVWMGWQAVRF